MTIRGEIKFNKMDWTIENEIKRRVALEDLVRWAESEEVRVLPAALTPQAWSVTMKTVFNQQVVRNVTSFFQP